MSADRNFPAAAMQRAIDHMNADHRDSLVEMVRAFAGCPWANDAELVSIEPRGFELWALGDGRREMARIAFDEPLGSAQQLRDAMVALARRARAQVEADRAPGAAAPMLAIDRNRDEGRRG